jgi:hypothetical protein
MLIPAIILFAIVPTHRKPPAQSRETARPLQRALHHLD